MRKVIVLKGLPGSGKSTYADQLMKEQPGAWKRINKDSLRAMLDGGRWSDDNEKFVLRARDLFILTALMAGKNVIVDDTNLHPKHEEQIRNLAELHKAAVEVKFIDTPIEICIERDLKRPNSVGEKVIRRMYSQFLREKTKVVERDPKLPDAIIVDMDGTLALHNGRSPYDTAKCGEDLVNEPIANIVRRHYSNPFGIKVLVVSGREDTYYGHTAQWLSRNNVPYDEVWMRPAGDKREDSIIKKEIYEREIKGKYNVLFILDDRPRICRMWFREGLTVLKVGDPDAEF